MDSCVPVQKLRSSPSSLYFSLQWFASLVIWGPNIENETQQAMSVILRTCGHPEQISVILAATNLDVWMYFCLKSLAFLIDGVNDVLLKQRPKYLSPVHLSASTFFRVSQLHCYSLNRLTLFSLFYFSFSILCFDLFLNICTSFYEVHNDLLTPLLPHEWL